MAKHALVIGITQYDYPYNFQSLTKPIKDAEAVARLLEERGGFQKVTRLPEGWNYEQGCPQVAADRVTSEQFVQALQTFLEEAGRGDAVIYYSGHGFVVPDKLNQRQNRKKGYLVTSDSQIETIAVHGIPFDSLNDFFHSSNLNSLVLLLDCCHAGSYLERDLVEQTLTAFGSQKDYYLMAACRSTEKAYEGEPEQENSVFTAALLEGLAQERADKDGQISCDRLFDFIYKNQKLRNFGQQPIRLGLGGSITLVTYPIENQEPAKLNRQNPYQGLRAFESEQANYFYGRDRVIRELLVRLNKDRFLSVIGPSGSGKSSLVKAGLLPQLKSNRIAESSQWDIESFTPGRHPLTHLQEIFARQHRRNQPYVLFIDQFEEVFTLCENEEERQTFMRLIVDEATNTERLARVIWAMRGDFLDRCAAYPEPATLINSTEPRTYIVPPFSLRELEEAIKKPAERHGVTFEEGLVSQILEDLEGQPGALPLLQYALSQLWQVCVEHSASEQPQLTQKGYKEIGGVKGALNETANNLYQTRSPEDRGFMRDLFMQLVQVEEDQVTRRPISWERLDAIANSSEQAQRVVGLLADQRLLVTDEKNVQVVHEALLSEWVLLRKWIEDNREDIRLSRRLEAYCREWQESFNQAENALLPDAWLAPIEDWVKRTQHQLRLTPLEAEYLQKSIEKRDREAQAKLKQERELREAAEARAKAEAEKAEQEKARAKAEAERAQEAEARAIAQAAKVKAEKQRTRLAIGSGVLGVILITFFGFLQFQLIQRSKAQELIAAAQALKNTNNQIEALMTSIKALDVLKIVNFGKGNSLKKIKEIIDSLRESNRLEYHQSVVLGLSFDSQGKLIASSDENQTIRLWKTNGIPLPLFKGKGHTNWVKNIKFSSDGKMLASASCDETVKIWQIDSTGQATLKNTLTGHKGCVYDVKFSPDNQTIASSGRDGKINLWNRDGNGSPIDMLSPLSLTQGQDYRIYSIDFNRDGSLLASAGYQDGKVNLWKFNQLANKQPISLGQPSDWHQDIVYIVKFCSYQNDTVLASGSQDGKVKLWKIEDEQGKLMGTINVNGDLSTIFGLGFNSTCSILATSSDDESIKLWNINTAKILWNSGHPILEEPLLQAKTLKGHIKTVNRVEFNPKDDRILASVGDDKTIRIWNLEPMTSNSEDKLNEVTLLKNSCTFIRNYIDSHSSLSEINKITKICNQYIQ